jgi:hypothetical protein
VSETSISPNFDSLSDDDKLVVFTPPGYQHLMLFAAYAKRALQYEMPAGTRLSCLNSSTV